MTQTITGLFDSYENASRAVSELERTGVPHGDISIVANNASDRWTSTNGAITDTTANATGTGATAGTLLGGGAGLLAGLGLSLRLGGSWRRSRGQVLALRPVACSAA